MAWDFAGTRVASAPPLAGVGFGSGVADGTGRWYFGGVGRESGLGTRWNWEWGFHIRGGTRRSARC